jgi:hypothetical protein
MKESVKEWTFTLPRELPLWEFGVLVDSWWTPEGLPNLQKAIAGVKIQWIEEFFISLENYWNVNVKMSLHDSFRHLKHKLWPKERPWVKLAFWLLTTKSWKSTQLPCVQVSCNIPLESPQQGLWFFLDFISIGGLHMKLWGPKIERVPTLGISGLPFGSLKTKCHLDVNFVERHKVYYKGEGGGFLQVRVMMSLVSSSLPVFCS